MYWIFLIVRIPIPRWSHVVKNYEASEILPKFQANMLIYQSFVDVHKRHACDFCVSSKRLYDSQKQESKCQHVVSVSQVPILGVGGGAMKIGPAGWQHVQQVVFQEGNPKLGASSVGSQTIIQPALCLRRRHFLSPEGCWLQTQHWETAQIKRGQW